jgi:hypothetical protein
MRRALVLAAVLSGCTSSGVDLLVDLKTDLRPGYEFTSVRTTLVGGGESVSEQSVPVTRGDDYTSGVRVAELRGLPAGSRRLHVELRDLDGEVVVGRDIVVELTESRGVMVVFTRDCRGLECPAAGGDPAETECLAGRCVTPDCLDGTCAETTGCAGDDECVSGASCVEGRCSVERICLMIARDATCGAAELCDPDRGCVADPMAPMDGGGPDTGARDTGAGDAASDGGPDAPADTGPDACSGECAAGMMETEDRPCGCGGTERRSRTCDDTCIWGAWSGWGSCMGSSGSCMPGETRGGCSDPCENQVCRSDCTWSGCRTRSSVDCSYEGGGNWRCCGTDMWQYCSASCSWNTCAPCPGGCGCP